VNYLLDTHILLWLRLSPEKLRPEHKKIIESSENEKFVSSVTQWEISLKFAVGKLELGKHTPDEFLAGIYKIGLKDITPSPEQWSTYYLLPKIKDHRDPFDRMIIWLAIQSGMTLLSSDGNFDKYKPHGLSLV
jgi:PIN domain nuclease of toxin-antitoxin system